MSPDERRKDERVDLSVPCLVTWENQTFDARTVNLSQGGTCIDIERILIMPPKGTRIQLTIRWKGMHQLSGRVRYSVRADEARRSSARFGVEIDQRGDYERFRSLIAALT